jgi:hypothetical protein
VDTHDLHLYTQDCPNRNPVCTNVNPVCVPLRSSIWTHRYTGMYFDPFLFFCVCVCVQLRNRLINTDNDTSEKEQRGSVFTREPMYY